MESVVELKWLYEHLKDEDLVIIDTRFNLADPSEGRDAYIKAHIPGAYYFDLEKDLSGEVAQHGGRHPLPDPQELALKLGVAGIDETKKVIVYDDQGGQYAPRLWWLLRYYGHDQVAVLDEGYSAWVEKGYPTTEAVPEAKTNLFVAVPDQEMIRTMVDVKKRGIEPLIDSRAPDRYRGENETMDPKAGHIPGARNFFWGDNVRQNKWLSPSALADRFHALKQADSVTVYCGSGVTACANILAMTRAGLQNVKLYPGSWSDWISYNNNPIETTPSS
ncbi:thiosulfate/3-mercaptopyruvate sulfurtransferase [Pullulanibacillus pueri]|uniref:Thiosulfate sulfurtransferase n=1 Tax=Pullulanibacillus pueri TaxID=1437324 RepID=A0A8J3EMY1_9BACL|nr:sulfurtransferase [Pullulanibacillus pueri]MBM7680536.1 thiosulfate/3-mercaptopyruvate sulfurtransferase [Pullulanibacillus pueri]GGH86151.1 thiosulfate sulfurtransferase [Pullulanibacillus pueri]